MALPKIIKLKGGATLLYKKRTINHSTGISIYFTAGSRYDGDLPGICHFVEHMLINETKDLTIEQVREKHKQLVSGMNGSTRHRGIDFRIWCADSNFEEGLKLLTSQVFEPGLSQTAVDKEREVVLKEMVRWFDNERAVCALELDKISLPNSEFTQLVIGTEEAVKKVTSNDVLEFSKSNFVLNNLIVSVAGRMSKGKVKKLVNKYIINKIIDRTNTPRELNFNYDFASKSAIAVTNMADRKNATMQIMLPMQLPKDRKTDWILWAISYLLNGLGGIAMNVLREERALVYSCDASIFNDLDFAYFTLSVDTSPKSVNEIFSAANEILKRLKMTEEKLKEWKERRKILEDKEMPSYLIDNAFNMVYTFRQYGNFNTK
ncbi:MAG: insulinase family protein [Firmicutes bacterium]|nr:insulinase family protein [Bacillota bacterium]